MRCWWVREKESAAHVLADEPTKAATSSTLTPFLVPDVYVWAPHRYLRTGWRTDTSSVPKVRMEGSEGRKSEWAQMQGELEYKDWSHDTQLYSTNTTLVASL